MTILCSQEWLSAVSRNIDLLRGVVRAPSMADAGSEASLASFALLKVFSGTWNLGERKGPVPQEAMMAWLPSGQDIYAVCAQECVDMRQFTQDVCERLGPSFLVVSGSIGSSATMLGYHGHILLIVAVRQALVEVGIARCAEARVKTVQLGKQLPTGRAANKGAVAITLPIVLPSSRGKLELHSSLVFVGAHLVADTPKRSYLSQRNADAAIMLGRLGLAVSVRARRRSGSRPRTAVGLTSPSVSESSSESDGEAEISTASVEKSRTMSAFPGADGATAPSIRQHRFGTTLEPEGSRMARGASVDEAEGPAQFVPLDTLLASSVEAAPSLGRAARVAAMRRAAEPSSTAEVSPDVGPTIQRAKSLNRVGEFDAEPSTPRPGEKHTLPSRAYTVMMGDLNYRLALPPSQVVKEIVAAEETSKLGQMGGEQPWHRLLAVDELRMAMAAGYAFPSFDEPAICFPPTYRRVVLDDPMAPAPDRASGVFTSMASVSELYAVPLDASEPRKLRTPSYTDRVLLRRPTRVRPRLPQAVWTSYRACEALTGSDHVAVGATLVIDLRKRVSSSDARLQSISRVPGGWMGPSLQMSARSLPTVPPPVEHPESGRTFRLPSGLGALAAASAAIPELEAFTDSDEDDEDDGELSSIRRIKSAAAVPSSRPAVPPTPDAPGALVAIEEEARPRARSKTPVGAAAEAVTMSLLSGVLALRRLVPAKHVASPSARLRSGSPQPLGITANEAELYPDPALEEGKTDSPVPRRTTFVQASEFWHTTERAHRAAE
jgi:hypothetical protein